MNKKTIQIGIVVLCFAGAGYVLYNGLSGGGSSKTPVSSMPLATIPGAGPAAVPGSPSAQFGQANSATSTTLAIGRNDAILPLGQNLDLVVLNERNFKFDIIAFPQVAKQEVGISEENLIQAPAPTAGSPPPTTNGPRH